METLHPGVYIKEIPSGVQPIEGVSTSTAAFIGKTEMGPLNTAQLVTSVSEFQKRYGGFLTDSYLAHAVFQFFNNGGKKTYVVRIAGGTPVAADISIKDRKAVPSQTLTISASSGGVWGNKLAIAVTDGTFDPDNEFSIQVFRERDDLNPPLPPLLLETHGNLSMNSAAANFVEKVVAANSSYIVVNVSAANQASALPGTCLSGPLSLAIGNGAEVLKLGTRWGGAESAGSPGPPATSGISLGGQSPSTNPNADARKLTINLDGDGPQEITIMPSAATGADIANSIQIAVRALKAKTAANQGAYDGFTASYQTPAAPAPPFYRLISGSKGNLSQVVVTDAKAAGLAAGTYRFLIQVNGDGPQEVVLTGPLNDGPAIQGAIQSAVTAITAKRAVTQAAFTGFKCLFQNAPNPANPSLLLTSGVAGPGSAVVVTNAINQNVATLLKLGLTNGGRQINGSAILRPANSAVPDTEYHLGVAGSSGNVFGVLLGDDGSTPGDNDYTGGLTALDAIRDVNLVIIPGIGSQNVVSFAANYCSVRGDCFFIGDGNSTDDSVAEAQAFVNGLTVKTSYAATYYPWLRMVDPTNVLPSPIPVPPSGFVAGMYAKIDANRGVWKAPAGTEANLGGAAGLVADTTDAQQDFLNPIGVNVIRSFPAAGIVIWGARTLATRSDPEYRYIPVRRTAIFLEQSIYNGIQYAVFEPNDAGLWASLRLNISSFMLRQFRAGAFQGRTPTDAFFVKVDDQTTTQQDIDAGVVNILVGFAPLKPAEFVILQLTQKAGQPGA
jgi:phage tail sheath protein FI